jgi:hypothetical protein
MSSVSPASKEKALKEKEALGTSRKEGDSRTPLPRTRTQSRGQDSTRRSDSSEIIVHGRSMQCNVPSGTIVWPMLSPTNYIYMEWALVMQINLDASFLREAVDGFPVSVPNVKAALGAISRSVPPKMVGMLVVKKTAKEAWETVMTMRLGVPRVKEATTQRL